MSVRHVVLGDGWAALASLVRLLEDAASAEDQIFWVPGSGGRALPAAGTLEGDRAAMALERMATILGVELGERLPGPTFLREFRNKSFRAPVWTKASELTEQRARREAELWKAESALMPVSEVRWSRSLVEIEDDFREKLLAHPRIQRREGVPVEGFEVVDGQVKSVIFGSGEKLEADHFVYADRWSRLGGLSGLPKPMAWNRGREAMGVLQVVLSHHQPIRPDVSEAFFAAMNRDSGETADRHVVGHFFREGRESVWSTVISADEGEDNHAIAKKLRRIKQALDKMFSESEWTSGAFEKTVKNEQVRYEEQLVFSGGEVPQKPIVMIKGGTKCLGIEFVTDGYGASLALEQACGAWCDRATVEGLTPSTQAEISV